MSEELTVDLDALTVEDIEYIEDYCDLSIDEVMQGKARKGKVLRAFAFVAMRHKNPNVTLEEVGKLSLSAFGGLPFAQAATQRAASSASKGSPRSRKPSA